MAEIKLRFDLTFSRRFVMVAGALVIGLCAVPELDSESVTLSTYYPAPSGVYTNMITTSDTFLARDGGNVGIFTVAPAAKLDVNGTMRVSGTATMNAAVTGNFGLMPNYVNWAAYGTGAGGAAIYNSNEAAYQALMLVGNNSGGGIRRVKVWDELTVNGNTVVTGNISNNGYVTSSSFVRAATAIVSQQGPLCGAPQEYTYPTPGGGTQALCPGQYVATTTGFYSKYIVLPVDRGPNLSPPVNPTANYICCPCPSSGCNL